ncbi:phosphoribosylanthranilate isomerase [Oxalobacteraceae bacterium GrIS 2.11]
MVTRIKICGLTRKADVQTAINMGANALGFVFYPQSPRYVSPAQAAELMDNIPPFVTTVGLFVNASGDEVAEVIAKAPVKLLQFHGDETPEQCHVIAERVQKHFLRALRVKPDMVGNDLVQYDSLYQISSKWFSALLLDTYVDSYGGSGKVFDWSIIPKELAPRVVLSGGLTAQNVSGAVSLLRPSAVDVSSGVEQAKGIKDPAKMQAFIHAVRLADTYLPENSYESQSNNE